jgi:hypothetical protein
MRWGIILICRSIVVAITIIDRYAALVLPWRNLASRPRQKVSFYDFTAILPTIVQWFSVVPPFILGRPYTHWVSEVSQANRRWAPCAEAEKKVYLYSWRVEVKIVTPARFRSEKSEIHHFSTMSRQNSRQGTIWNQHCTYMYADLLIVASSRGWILFY